MNWLLSGIMGMFFYGLFGIFNNFSTYQNPFQSNLIIQISGFFGAILLTLYIIFSKKEQIKFSLNAFLAGVFGATGTYFVLSSLMDNQLIVVYPFAAMSGLFFFILNYVLYKPMYSSKQFQVLSFGLAKITSLVQNLIIAILTNGEIIPITIFAVVFLGQYNIEGIIGASISIVGLTLINLVDSL